MARFGGSISVESDGHYSILLTGHASVELAVAAIQEYGAQTCLQKESFRRVEFREIINKALATPASTEIEILETDTITTLSAQNQKKLPKAIKRCWHW